MPAAHNGLSKARGCLWYSLANWEDEMLRFRSRSVAHLGDGPGPQLFWVKKEEMTEGEKVSRGSKSRPRNHFFIIIETKINKSPSQIMFTVI